MGDGGPEGKEGKGSWYSTFAEPIKAATSEHSNCDNS